MPGNLQGPSTGFVSREKGKNLVGSGFLAKIGKGGMVAGAGGVIYTSMATCGQGNIVFSANPTALDTITIGTTTWTFETSGASGTQTNIKASLALTLVQLVADLRASNDAQIVKAVYSANATTLFVAAVTPGTSTLALAASAATASGAAVTGGGGVVGNGADTTEDTLITLTLPANTFDVVGRSLEIQAWGSVPATSATKTARLYFGTSIVPSVAYTTTQTGLWQIKARIWKVASGGQLGLVKFDAIGATTAEGSVNVVGCEPDNAPIVIKVTGQSTAATANLVTLYGFSLSAYN